MGTDSIISIVEEKGLITRENISRYFEQSSEEEVSALHERLRDALRESSQTVGGYLPTAYNYIASSSIRGESRCALPECRADQVGELARFSLLYADKVILPLLSPGSGALGLQGDLMILSELRPLIDLGIVIPTSCELYLCEEHKCRCEAIGAEFIKVAKSASDELAERVTVTYTTDDEILSLYPDRDATSVLKLQQSLCILKVGWPDDYGQKVSNSLFLSDPDLVKSIRELAKSDTRLPVDFLRRNGILFHYFEKPAFDYVLHSVFNGAADWRYLSDSVLETRLFRSLAGGGESEEAKNIALDAMAHEIPLFVNVALETLVRVRQEESDSFSAYRGALNDALKEAGKQGIGIKSVREIYQDIVFPKLSALELREKTLNKRFGKNLLLGYVPSAATLAIGVFADAQSAGMGQFMGKFIEAFGLGILCNQVAQYGASKDSVKNDPFYFLLKLKKSHENACH
jgi:hypothetical protein